MNNQGLYIPNLWLGHKLHDSIHLDSNDTFDFRGAESISDSREGK